MTTTNEQSAPENKAATKPEIEHVDVDNIQVRVRRRRLDDKKVKGIGG